MVHEARKELRYPLKGGVLAAIAVPGELRVRLGEALDVSRGGLAFLHATEAVPSGELVHLHLFGHEESDLWEKQIPCKVVYDSLASTDLRRCGLHFTGAAPDLDEEFGGFLRGNVV